LIFVFFIFVIAAVSLKNTPFFSHFPSFHLSANLCV
jgi:hypothetical protein